MRTTSLTTRAVALVLLVEFVCALLFSLTALWYERTKRIGSFDEQLQGRSDSLLGAIQDAEDPSDNVMVDPSEVKVPGGDFYGVYNPDGRPVAIANGAPLALVEKTRDGFATRRVGGHSYRVLQRDGMRIIDRAETGGTGLRRPVTIVYAARSDQIRRDILQAATFYSLLSGGLLCVTGASLILLLRRLLHPLQELAESAASVSATSLSFHAPESVLGTTELRSLADVLTSTMTRLREAFALQQRFFGDAAHELKTAVAVVRSSVQVLTMRRRSEEEYESGLHQILADNERVEELVGRMLMLTRLEESADAGTMAIDLAECARGVMERLGSLAAARGVALRGCVMDAACVLLSRDRAEVLVSNLLVNATQHSEPGSEVEISVRAEPEEGWAVLEVQDRGAGISAAALPHVFERFYREDRSRSRATGGAGLGLAICKAIVDGAGGSLEIWSEEAQGTRVVVRFRLA